ncbi:MAG: cupin domain-containing protein [Holophaga sp.]|nr:cupin domain-containing protein [Holophaga sp.]
MTPAFQKPLVVFEMANNHMGDVGHGLDLIDAFARVADPFRSSFDFGFKLQYRDLDTFIHPAFRDRTDIKHIKRFLETRLEEPDFLRLLKRMEERGFTKICTPFDEISVDRIEAHGIQWLKIASCSLGDWPLMERIAQSALPIIASTAGSSLETMDRVVSFFEHRGRSLSILHCVGEYPTPTARQHLHQIVRLASRYPNHPVGFSSHEDPSDIRTVQMAVAKGARILERHVGLPTDTYKLNAYSLTPAQCSAWLQAAQEAFEACGDEGGRHAFSEAELASLHELRRGVFARAELPAGHRLEREDLVMAMPTAPGQVTANDLGKYVEFTLTEAVVAGAPILQAQVTRRDNHERVRSIVDRVRRVLEAGHTTVGPKCDVEISHHYGIDRFEEVGATIISVVNRAYCKKLIIMLPGQLHPEQYHKEKEETFHLLHGTLKVRLDGQERIIQPGDVITVERGVRHEFLSPDGCILEEISSTHFRNDSFYTDASIGTNPYRKTYITHFFG